MSRLRLTNPQRLVLRALLRCPRELYGLELVAVTEVPRGTLYPLLRRFESAGWVTRRDEDRPPSGSRAARTYYVLTPAGTALAESVGPVRGAA